MLLTIATTHEPATDLGYLLHKNPARPQAFELAFGTAHVFYPEADERRCEAALLLEIDPVALVRKGATAVTDYVNDRPYAAGSFLAVAMGRVFGTAMGGRAKERPELAASKIPLEARIAAVPQRGEPLLKKLFEPLGYEVEVTEASQGGRTTYHNVRLTAEKRLADLLTHIYVLLPVTDNRKHYRFGEAEVDNLLSKGKGWLEGHPCRELITKRFLAHRKTLAAQALASLVESDGENEPEETKGEENAAGQRMSLHDERIEWVAEALTAAGTRRVVDLGCGEGRLLRRLQKISELTEIVGADASPRALEIAARRLRSRTRASEAGGRLKLLQTGLTYRDGRLAGYDAAAVVEVIEHLEPERVKAFEQVLFGEMQPRVVALTTPNREYNRLFESLQEGALRHRDHRFEWTRAEFENWAGEVARRYGYRVETGGIGTPDPEAGAPSQRGLFTRCN